MFDTLPFLFQTPYREQIIMPLLIFLLLIATAFTQEQKSQTALQEALLNAAIESQVAAQNTYRSEVLMHRTDLDKAKAAKIKPNARQADGFGVNIDGQYYVPNKKAQEQAVAHYREKLINAERKYKDLVNKMLPILDYRKLATGQAGFLGLNTTFPTTINVFQVINDSQFLGKIQDEVIIVKGVSTADLTDGKDVSLPFPIEVLGTETYQTKFGTKTVFAVRMFSRDEAMACLQYVDENRPKPKPILRDWKAIDGSLIMEAEYISHDKKNVVVKDAKGQEHTIEITKLNKSNRTWLKDQ